MKEHKFPLRNCHFSVVFFSFFFFYQTIFPFKIAKPLLLLHYILIMYSFNLNHLLLLQSGDTETNPGPKKSSRLNFCHWNLSGIVAHDFVKVSLRETFIKVNNIDIIYLSGIFLDSTVPLDDERLDIKGYSMIRADHPNTTQ